MGTFYNSFKRRLMLLCMIALLLILIAIHTTMYILIKNVVSEQIGLNAQSTATAIAGSIMEDIDSYKNFLETRDASSDYYRRMQAYFTKIKDSGDIIKFIYTEMPVDDKTVEFILDAEPVGSKDYSPPGSTTFMDDAAREVYATGLPVRLKPTVHPDYGTLLGGCAPIFDRDGKVLGLVGVNLDISEMLNRLNTLQLTMLLLYAVILGICLTLLRKYSSLILEPMIKDKLTGAYSKRYCDTLIRREIRNSARFGSELCFMMLDLDHFKKVNDTYGHAFGDKVLESVAKTIMSCLRANDYFIRYGGEEFAVIMPRVDIESALKIAERIRLSVESGEIYNEEEDLAIKITISIGVSRLDSRDSPDKQLVERADKALYDAKVTRNAVSRFVDLEF